MGKKKTITQPEEIRKAMEQRICTEDTSLAVRQLALAFYHGGTCLPMYRTEAKITAKACLMGVNQQIFAQALSLLFGEQEASDLLEILNFRIQGNLSEAIFRTPFHSKNSHDYVDRILLPTIFRWVCGTGFDLNIIDWLMDPDLLVSQEYDLANRLALELQRNADAGDIVMHILNQDPDSPRLISREILQAVIRSGFRPGIDAIKVLLMEATVDHKLKEMIFDVIDEGTTETYIDFLEWIQKEKVYRSPLAARAIDTWLWLGFGALEPQMAELILEEALTLLKNSRKCYLAVEQGDMLKAHIALWALAVHNIRQIWPILWDMLQSSSKDQIISAIYFISNVQHEYLDFEITVELLEKIVHETDSMELLAWLMPNLIPTDLQQRLADRPQDRQHYFALLEHVLHLIGKEERIFCGKPFVWTTIRLTPELAVEAMLRVASISKDRSMIRCLARNFDYFTPKQRGYFYEYLLDPMHWREDDFFLRDHMKDRSALNRQVIAAKLAEVRAELERTNYQTNRL